MTSNNSNNGNSTEQTTPDDNIGSTEHTHSYTSTITRQPTCTDEGVTTFTCSCGDSYTIAIQSTGHTDGKVETENEIASTCTEDGSYVEVIYCTVCNEELSRETITISATGHTDGEIETENEIAATCTEDGSYDEIIYCTVCNEELSRETITVEATGHNYSSLWSYDESMHWHAATCGHDVTADYYEHTFTGGVCPVCDYEKIIGAEGLEYTLSSDGTYYTVTGIGTATATDIVIPSKYNDLPVTAIAASAFKDYTSLTSIIVPDNVTSIGSGAFSGCSSLQSITLPFVGGNSSANSTSSTTVFGYIFGTNSYTGGTLTEQSYKSFFSTTYYIPTSLRSVTITGGNILYGAFYHCSKLTSITIGNGVTSIGSYAFAYCEQLTNIAISNSVTSISMAAFWGCTSLTSISIPNSVTSISNFAFMDCTALTSITIPNSVTSISSYAFYGCSNLTSVTFENTSGWTAGRNSISSNDLADTSTAAKYLTSDYCDYSWKRS